MDWLTRISLRTLGQMSSTQPLIAPRFATGTVAAKPSLGDIGMHQGQMMDAYGESTPSPQHMVEAKKYPPNAQTAQDHAGVPKPDKGKYSSDEPADSAGLPKYLVEVESTRQPNKSIAEDKIFRNDPIAIADKKEERLKTHRSVHPDTRQHPPKQNGLEINSTSGRSSIGPIDANDRSGPIISNLVGLETNASETKHTPQPWTSLASGTPMPYTQVDSDSDLQTLLPPDSRNLVAREELLPARSKSLGPLETPASQNNGNGHDRQASATFFDATGLSVHLPEAQPGLDIETQPLTHPPAPAEPNIEVTIGSIEVRAVSPFAPKTPQRQRAAHNVQTLDQYLHKRSRKGLL